MWRAAALMILGMACIPAGDTAGKLLTSQGVAPFFVAWSRFAIGALLALALVDLKTLGVLRDWRIWLRAALIGCAISSILTALKTAPLADAFGAFFIGPVVAYTASALFLKEPAPWSRSVLIGLGFIGVLMVVQPGGTMAPGLGFAVLAGTLYGLFLTTSKWVVDAAPPKTLWFTQLAIPAVALAPLGLAGLPPLDAATLGLTAASALFSGFGNLLLILAMGLAHSTRLAPLVYVQLVAAVALGVVVFGTWPNALALAGIGVILASGLAGLLVRR